LQLAGIAVLDNLACCSYGKTKAAETAVVEVALAFLNNHLRSTADICKFECDFISRIVVDSKENTELCISSGGVTTMAKVRKEWPDDDNVEGAVRIPMEPVVKVLSCWTQAK
jgi:hypothetical protein